MARYKTKAETNFEKRFADALAERDWSRVEGLLTMFGMYYQLAEGEELIGTEVLFEWFTEKYDPTVNLPDWNPPVFFRESKVESWLKEDAETARQAALYAFSGHPVPTYYMSID